jgi:hypothetical protein
MLLNLGIESLNEMQEGADAILNDSNNTSLSNWFRKNFGFINF